MIAVAAGILIKDGKILLCRRKAGGTQSLKWEFPGGKLEKGESPEAALERELFEELGIRTRTGHIFDVKVRSDPDRDLLLLFYYTELISGTPSCIDCTAFEWTEPANLRNYDLADTDALIAEELEEI